MTDMPVEARAESTEGELAIHIGNPVRATDGQVGQVGDLVRDPDTQRVTHMMLQEGHLWGKKQITLPLSAIDRVHEDTVYLKLDKQAIKELPAIPIKRHRYKDEYEPERIELVARIFDKTDKAGEALEFVQGLHRRKIIKILNAAVLVKEQDGTTSLLDTKGLQPKKGRLIGAITGGLVGLVAGPVGVVVGALVGVGAGSLAAKWVDLGFSDDFLIGLQKHMQPGSSALILLAKDHWVQPMSEALSDWEGITFQQTLTDEMVEKLMQEADGVQ